MEDCVTCLKCGRVHFGVTREYVEEQVKQANEYLDSLLAKKRKKLYGNQKSKIDQYKQCFTCKNSYENFREFEEGDCDVGVTLSPILKKGQ